MQADDRGKIRRKNYFINKKFQSQFIIKFCFLIMLACVVFGTAVYLLSTTTTTTAFENSRLIIKSTADYLLPLLILTSLMTIFIVSIATIMLTLFISHKIAGPAYRFERVAEEIGRGNLNLQIKLRSKDQFQPIAEGLDVMAANLKRHIITLKEKQQQLSSAIAKMSPIEDNKTRERVAELEKIIDDLARELDYFKV